MRALGSAVGVMALLAAVGCGRGRDEGFVIASGHVEATDVRLATKVAGRIVEVRVEEGDAVRAGEIVARVDTTDLELLRAQMRADRDQAKADFAMRRAGARQEDVAEARAQVASLEADLDGAQRDLARMQTLLDKGSGTEKARDDARTRRDVLAGHLAAARQTLARFEAGFRREEVESARARLDAAEARLAQLDRQIADATITSPLESVVTEKLVEAGEWVSVGAGVAILSDLARPWLTVYVDEPDLARVRVGQEVDVATDDGSRRTGRVTWVAPKAEFTPKNVQTRDERAKLVFRVKVGLDNADGLFKPGMPAEARFTKPRS